MIAQVKARPRHAGKQCGNEAGAVAADALVRSLDLLATFLKPGLVGVAPRFDARANVAVDALGSAC